MYNFQACFSFGLIIRNIHSMNAVTQNIMVTGLTSLKKLERRVSNKYGCRCDFLLPAVWWRSPHDSSHFYSTIMTATIDSTLQVQNLSQRNTNNNRKPWIRAQFRWASILLSTWCNQAFTPSNDKEGNRPCCRVNCRSKWRMISVQTTADFLLNAWLSACLLLPYAIVFFPRRNATSATPL